jgi:hypothetical protein
MNREACLCSSNKPLFAMLEGQFVCAGTCSRNCQVTLEVLLGYEREIVFANDKRLRDQRGNQTNLNYDNR